MPVQTRKRKAPVVPPPPAPHAVLRRWLSVFVAGAIVLAASGALTVRAVVGRSITVAGTVLDSRTDKPVSGAAVTSKEPLARRTTDATGRFHIPEVRNGAKLSFSAPNYKDATFTATADAIRLRLEPIAVTGTVTSAYTGKGIAATIIGRETHATQADGIFRTYGVGPGDTLKISAYGHEATTVTIGADRTAKAALKLGRIDPAAVLKPISGYGFVDMPSDIVDGLRAEVAYADPEFASYITGFKAASVVHNGETVAVAFVMALDPQFAVLPGAAETFYTGVSDGAAAIETIKIGETTAKKMRDADGALGYAWQEYAGFLFVYGGDAKAVEAFVKTQVLGETSSV